MAKYTGFKDVEGKEIYEGDILSVTTYDFLNIPKKVGGKIWEDGMIWITGEVVIRNNEVMLKDDWQGVYWGLADLLVNNDVRIINSFRESLTKEEKDE